MRGMFSSVNLKTSEAAAGTVVASGDTADSVGNTAGEGAGEGSIAGDRLGGADAGAGLPELQAERAVTKTAQAISIKNIRFILFHSLLPY